MARAGCPVRLISLREAAGTSIARGTTVVLTVEGAGRAALGLLAGVEGTTSTLWTLLGAAGFLTTSDPRPLLFWASVFLAAGALTAVALAAARARGSTVWTAGAWLAGACLAVPPLLVWSSAPLMDVPAWTALPAPPRHLHRRLPAAGRVSGGALPLRPPRRARAVGGRTRGPGSGAALTYPAGPALISRAGPAGVSAPPGRPGRWPPPAPMAGAAGSPRE